MSEKIETARALPVAKTTEFIDGKAVEDWVEYVWACAPEDADALLKSLPADAAFTPFWRGQLTDSLPEMVVMRFRTRARLVRPDHVDAVAEAAANGVVGVFS